MTSVEFKYTLRNGKSVEVHASGEVLRPEYCVGWEVKDIYLDLYDSEGIPLTDTISPQEWQEIENSAVNELVDWEAFLANEPCVEGWGA